MLKFLIKWRNLLSQEILCNVDLIIKKFCKNLQVSNKYLITLKNRKMQTILKEIVALQLIENLRSK